MEHAAAPADLFTVLWESLADIIGTAAELGMAVGSPFEGLRGVLTGLPVPSPRP